jgi:hypothetical protein
LVAVEKKFAACALEHRARVARSRKSDFPLRARPGLLHGSVFRVRDFGVQGVRVKPRTPSIIARAGVRPVADAAQFPPGL